MSNNAKLGGLFTAKRKSKGHTSCKIKFRHCHGNMSAYVLFSFIIPQNKSCYSIILLFLVRETCITKNLILLSNSNSTPIIALILDHSLV